MHDKFYSLTEKLKNILKSLNLKLAPIPYTTEGLESGKWKKINTQKTLAKNQVCETFQMRDIGKNGLPKFIELCMETPCWCPFQEHQYGRRIPTETSVFEFSY